MLKDLLNAILEYGKREGRVPEKYYGRIQHAPIRIECGEDGKYIELFNIWFEGNLASIYISAVMPDMVPLSIYNIGTRDWDIPVKWTFNGRWEKIVEDWVDSLIKRKPIPLIKEFSDIPQVRSYQENF